MNNQDKLADVIGLMSKKVYSPNNIADMKQSFFAVSALADALGDDTFKLRIIDLLLTAGANVQANIKALVAELQKT